MRKIFLATVAFSIIATPAAFAQPYKQHQAPQYKHQGQFKQGQYDGRRHRWSKGQRLSAGERRHVVNSRDYRRYRLHQPPRGYHWVRVDNDFILVAAATGIISSIIGGALYNNY